MIDRITILGGSSVYIPEFVLSAIARNLNVKEIVLFGQAGRKLDVVAAFCQRLLDKSGFPAQIVPMSDLAESVKGAKYILNHIRVGGMRARMRDEMLPLRFEMIGSDTLGAGGFANAMRTLPVIFELAKQIEEANPEAVFINLTNPMGIIVEGLVKYTKLNTLGVSDLPGAYIKKVAAILQQDPADLCADYIGLHQLGWIQDIKIGSRSHMSQLLDLLDDQEEDEFDYELIDLFRMIPTRHTGVYFHRGDVLKKQLSTSRFRSEILHEAEQQILDLYADPHLDEIPELTRQRNAVWYEQTILPLLQALESKDKCELVLCIRNDECIRDLPPDCSVEVPVSVSRKAVRPRKVGSMPRFLKGMFLAAKESDRLTVEAVRHKSYEYALQALTTSPFVPSIGTARKFLDRIIRDEKLELH